MLQTYLPLVEYYKKCLNTAKLNGFVWTISILSRRADTERLYDKLLKQWHSLGNITGNRILFVFSCNRFNEPTVIFKNKKRGSSGYINQFIRVSKNFPLFGMNCAYGFGKVANEPKKNLIDLHSDSISEMMRYLKLAEKDVPCMIITNLISNKNSVVNLIDDFDCYSFIKLIIESIEEQLLEYERFYDEEQEFFKAYNNYSKFIDVRESIKNKSIQYSKDIQRVFKSYLNSRDKQDFDILKKVVITKKNIKELRSYNNMYSHFYEKYNRDYKCKDNYMETLISKMDESISEVVSIVNNNNKYRMNKKKMSILEIVQDICNCFKSLIEDNAGWKICLNKGEKMVQRLFFIVANIYCRANNLDLSAESNNGRGSVDFKISYGACQKVIIEIKLTSNDKWQNGYGIQLPIYLKQEKSENGIYLIYDNGNPDVVDKFIRFYANLDEESKIPYYIIDGTPKESASKASKI